jgi:hypothetical protein
VTLTQRPHHAMPKTFFGNQRPTIFSLAGDHFEKQTLIRIAGKRCGASEGLRTHRIINSLVIEKALDELALAGVCCDEYSLEVKFVGACIYFESWRPNGSFAQPRAAFTCQRT